MLMDPNNSFAMDPRMVAIGRWSSWKRSSPKTQKIFSKCAVTPKIAVKKDPKLWIHIPKDVALMSQKNNRFQSYVQMPKTTAPQIQLPKYQVQVPNSFFLNPDVWWLTPNQLNLVIAQSQHFPWVSPRLYKRLSQLTEGREWDVHVECCHLKMKICQLSQHHDQKSIAV